MEIITGDRDAVVFVNRFTVHAEPERFEQVFAASAEFLAARPGFLSHLLVRHVGQAGSYVNIAYWRDEVSFRGAVADPAFAPHAAALRELSTSEPNLYRPVQSRRHAEAAPARSA